MIFHSTLISTLLTSFAATAPLLAGPPIVKAVFATSKSDFNDLVNGAMASDTYTTYSGDGSTASGWPGMDEWVSFQEMFDSNAAIMRKSCTSIFGLPAGSDTSEVEIGEVWKAIQAVAQETGVDHRFILAVMMQESAGCVRVWTTRNSIDNPGMMQDHAGGYSCNPGGRGESWGLINPCPADQIMGMIRDGVDGTTAGDGLAGLLNAVVATSGDALDGSSAQLYYEVARAYNSGSLDRTDLNQQFGSSKCYTMDIANRLTGWVSATKQCTEW